MLSTEQLLEAITESIRQQRRYGVRKTDQPRFPTLFDLSHIVYDVDAQTIEMCLMDDKQPRKFRLKLEEDDGI